MTGPRKSSRRTQGRRESGASLRDVDQPAGAYEAEGSERPTLGSVSVATDGWWSATLTVPMLDGGTALLSIERQGPPPQDYRGSSERAEFSVPSWELDAVVALLAGVVAQARREGVLAAQSNRGRPARDGTKRGRAMAR